MTVVPQHAAPVAPPALPASRLSARSSALACFAGPVAGAAATFAVVSPDDHPYKVSAMMFIALLGARMFSDREPGWVQVLPLVGYLARLLTLVIGAVVVGALYLGGALPGVEVLHVGLIACCAAVVDGAAAMFANRPARKPPVRIAVVGSAQVAESLDREMRLAGLSHRYDIVGRIIGTDEPWTEGDEVPVIGRVGELADAVVRLDLHLLLMSSKVPRMTLFEDIVQTCLHLPVRMHELSSFYERVFCHVASAEINAAWFQYIVHPKYQAGSSRSERVLDLVVAAAVAVVALPVMGVLALLIRRDGGPAFFRQLRIGEGGQPFTMYKLRTMRVDNEDTSWSASLDTRVTPIGRFLRRTHLDELPQLLNVLRGDMSIVGPRPEQPQLVDELELLMPFYQRRHLMKPGVTGWAQVRCGYAGSHAGSAWKLCHDLYYLKHRSVWLNMVIILETVRTLCADRQYTARPVSVDFILAPAYTVGVPEPATLNI